jgi:hypothetical protein
LADVCSIDRRRVRVYQKGRCLLWTIAVILLILWGAGLVAGFMMGGLLHVLVVLAIAAVLMQKFSGKKAA